MLFAAPPKITAVCRSGAWFFARGGRYFSGPSGSGGGAGLSLSAGLGGASLPDFRSSSRVTTTAAGIAYVLMRPARAMFNPTARPLKSTTTPQDRVVLHDGGKVGAAAAQAASQPVLYVEPAGKCGDELA